jgi:hypothetical protein
MDTIVTNPEIVEIYKTLLQQETSNYTISIYVLLGITALLLGATWWWNKIGAVKQIRQEVEDRFAKEKDAIIHELSQKLKEGFDKEIRKYETRFLEIEVDISRAMAFICESNEFYEQAIAWWSRHINLNIKLDRGEGIRNGANLILDVIRIIEKKEQNLKSEAESSGQIFTPKKLVNYATIIKTINKLPEILNVEKGKIIQKLKNRYGSCNE